MNLTREASSPHAEESSMIDLTSKRMSQTLRARFSLANSKCAPRAETDTAGLPILWTHTNNQFANEPEGLRHF